mmetsp:Transcript_51922/g.110986  ORF Transcript_51922/g.110986 Transcript_51922/m.110986 type:complete len:224 (+) Transcript_51922:1027-1698(+)
MQQYVQLIHLLLLLFGQVLLSTRRCCNVSEWNGRDIALEAFITPASSNTTEVGSGGALGDLLGRPLQHLRAASGALSGEPEAFRGDGSLIRARGDLLARRGRPGRPRRREKAIGPRAQERGKFGGACGSGTRRPGLHRCVVRPCWRGYREHTVLPRPRASQWGGFALVEGNAPTSVPWGIATGTAVQRRRHGLLDHRIAQAAQPFGCSAAARAAATLLHRRET